MKAQVLKTLALVSFVTIATQSAGAAEYCTVAAEKVSGSQTYDKTLFLQQPANETQAMIIIKADGSTLVLGKDVTSLSQIPDGARAASITVKDGQITLMVTKVRKTADGNLSYYETALGGSYSQSSAFVVAHGIFVGCGDLSTAKK